MRPKTTPCIGKCSHNVGDDICKGCKRTIAEVRDWNTMTTEQKLEKMEELKVRGCQLMTPPEKPKHIPIISWDDL